MKPNIRFFDSIKIITLLPMIALGLLYTGNVYGQSLAEEWYSNRSF